MWSSSLLHDSWIPDCSTPWWAIGQLQALAGKRISCTRRTKGNDTHSKFWRRSAFKSKIKFSATALRFWPSNQKGFEKYPMQCTSDAPLRITSLWSYHHVTAYYVQCHGFPFLEPLGRKPGKHCRADAIAHWLCSHTPPAITTGGALAPRQWFQPHTRPTVWPLSRGACGRAKHLCTWWCQNGIFIQKISMSYWHLHPDKPSSYYKFPPTYHECNFSVIP